MLRKAENWYVRGTSSVSRKACLKLVPGRLYELLTSTFNVKDASGPSTAVTHYSLKFAIYRAKIWHATCTCVVSKLQSSFFIPLVLI